MHSNKHNDNELLLYNYQNYGQSALSAVITSMLQKIAVKIEHTYSIYSHIEIIIIDMAFAVQIYPYVLFKDDACHHGNIDVKGAKA